MTELKMKIMNLNSPWKRSSEEMDHCKVISVDFDLTISDSHWPNIGPPIKGAKKYINKLYDEGYGIVINSCRAGAAEGEAMKFMIDNKIKFDYFNCNVPWRIQGFGQDCRKISADVYIDDKNLGGFIPWKEAYEMIQKQFNND